jgi:hypothetical protein
MTPSPRRPAEPREVKPGTFALRAYIGRATGSPRYLHETYVSPRPDTGIDEAWRRLPRLERKATNARADSGTFGALLDQWLDHATSLRRSPTTLNGYRNRVAVIKGALGFVLLMHGPEHAESGAIDGDVLQVS